MVAVIVTRAQQINARSLQVSFFKRLVWTRFLVDREAHDLVFSTT
jgi:hypothetical protein